MKFQYKLEVEIRTRKLGNYGLELLQEEEEEEDDITQDIEE